jgi:hypothetical protein
VNVAATVRALAASLTQIEFAACKLFTDDRIELEHPEITVTTIPRLGSSTAYSDFLLSQMVDHIDTPHCLVVQWDGHVIDARRWREEFLDYDYVGASWPQFCDGHDVGNGGFSLRSRNLMELCRDPDFVGGHPEDVSIGRINRLWLEGRGMRFAPRDLADLFSTERTGDLTTSFGYHGVWNMPSVLGTAGFWQIYRRLDDRETVMHDLETIVKDLRKAPGGSPLRVLRLLADYVGDTLERKVRRGAGLSRLFAKWMQSDAHG